MLIVLDLGQVLSDHDGKVEALAAHWGVDPTLLLEPYWRHRLDYDGGCDNHHYWRQVGAALGVEVDLDLADQLSRHDAAGWVGIRPAAEQLLVDLHQAGVPTAILSNAPVDTLAAIEGSPWRRWVGEVVVSGVVGAVKPDPAIYAAVEQATSREPSDLHFVDDRLANVEGALARGWDAHLWRSDDDTRAWLTRIGALATSS